MCGRFELNISREELIKKFGIENWQSDNYRPRFNVSPGSDIPIIRKLGETHILNDAHWGLIPSWSKDRKIAYRTINARSETLAEKPSFRNAYKKRRCLIPASGYYEWKKLDSNHKQPYWIGRKDKEPFAMAGLYEDWTDSETGALIESCTIITRSANQEIQHIHDRMPVLLPENYLDDWLEIRLDDFPAIESSELEYYPVSKDVGSPRNDYQFIRIGE